MDTLYPSGKVGIEATLYTMHSWLCLLLRGPLSEFDSPMPMAVQKNQRVVRTCAHCKLPFVVNPRIGRRHRFCRKPECMRESRRRAQRKWRKSTKGREYFRGAANVLRVRAWRQAHPGYSRKGARAWISLHPELAVILEKLALRDSIDALALLVGLIADRTNLRLQDKIARELGRLIVLGHGLLH